MEEFNFHQFQEILETGIIGASAIGVLCASLCAAVLVWRKIASYFGENDSPAGGILFYDTDGNSYDNIDDAYGDSDSPTDDQLMAAYYADIENDRRNYDKYGTTDDD